MAKSVVYLTRSRTEHFLIGQPSSAMPNGCLPTNSDVLKDILAKKEDMGDNVPIKSTVSCPIVNDKNVYGAICRQVEGCITKSKNNVIENGHCTAQKIKTRWDQAGIETIQDIAICTKVVKFWEKYGDVKKKKVKKGAIEERESF